MDFNSIDELRECGFRGFVSILNLWQDRSLIPKEKGVYLVLDPAGNNTLFISPGVGGFFKGRDPNVSIRELQTNYVDQSLVIYIGKAGSLAGKATLRSRLGQYLKFGQGHDVGHWGGRYIWQIKNYRELLICWKPTPSDDPREVEKELITGFRHQFNTLPFANLRS